MRILFSIVFATSFLITSQAFSSHSLDMETVKPTTNKRQYEGKENEQPPNSPSKRHKPNDQIYVRKVDDISSFEQLDASDLVAPYGTSIIFFDIDETTAQPSHLLLNLHPDNQNEWLTHFYHMGSTEKGLFKEDGEFDLFKTYIQETNNFFSPHRLIDEMVVVEEAVLPFMNELRTKRALLIGLTDRLQMIEEHTQTSLKKLGIDFGALSEMNDSQLSTPEDPFCFKNGICYTNRKIKKRDAIPILVERIAKHTHKPGPYRCTHFDNDEDVIGFFKETARPTISSSTIIIQPVLYTGYNRFTLPKLNEKNLISELYNDFYLSGFPKWRETRG